MLAAPSLETPLSTRLNGSAGTAQSMRAKLGSERATIEVQLREGASSQLEATRDALARLRDTRVAAGDIREQMVNIERLCEDPRTVVEGMERINQVSRVHRHFSQVIDLVQSLTDVYDKIDRIDRLLQADQDDPLGPAPNLLPIHYHLTQIEAFRNETVLRAKRSSPEARATLDRYFERLSGALEMFDQHYLGIAGRLVAICRAGHPSVAVKLAKIAELEGSRDEKAIAIRIVKKQKCAGTVHSSTDAAAWSWRAGSRASRPTRGRSSTTARV